MRPKSFLEIDWNGPELDWTDERRFMASSFLQEYAQRIVSRSTLHGAADMSKIYPVPVHRQGDPHVIE